MLTTETYYVIMLTLSSYRATERGAMAGKHAIRATQKSSAGYCQERLEGRPQGSPPPHSTAPALTMMAIPVSGLSDFCEALSVPLKVRSYAPPLALLLTGTFDVFCSRQGVIGRLRRLSASARHQPTPLRVFLPVLPTKLTLLLTSSVRQNERHY